MTDEEETIGGLRVSKSFHGHEWKQLPIRLTLEKNKFYGVSLYIDYVTVKITPGGATIDIEEGVAELFDQRQMTDVEEQALESEVEMLLDSEAVPEEEENDEGKMVKLTDEERQSKAEDLAEQSELEYGSEVLEELSTAIENDETIPAMFLKEPYTFWTDEDRYAHYKDSPENMLDWLQPGEEIFLDTVKAAGHKIEVEEGKVPSTLRSYSLAVTDIMERLKHQDFMETFRKVIPVWSYLRLKYQLKDKDAKKRLTATEVQEKKDKLDRMRQWLRVHKLEMSDAARRMLDITDAARAKKPIEEKGKQMTIEGKKAKVPLRFNPEPYTEKLLDYYDSMGQDPEVPVDWLIAEGATIDQIWAAADELLSTGRIDPPDYWAITAALSGVDYHVRVPRGNPTATEELGARKKLQRAIHEKHGELPDKIDKAFKKLKIMHKGKSDAELLELAREEVGLKKHKNPSFKTAREALKDALKRLTTIEVVEYTPYVEPEVERETTIDESVAELEQVAKDITAEEQDAGVAAYEWQVMFDREKAEHPGLTDDVIKTIVDDHMKSGKRENPASFTVRGKLPTTHLNVEDRIIKAFWDKVEKAGPKATPMSDPDSSADRRDEVVVHGPGEFIGEQVYVSYLLWGHAIARLMEDDQGHLNLGLSTAGWDTMLTNERLGAILSEGQKRYPAIKNFAIRKDNGIRLYIRHKLRKIDPEEPWRTTDWEEVCPIPSTMYGVRDLPKGQMAKYSVYINLEGSAKENVAKLTGKAIRPDIEEMKVPTDTLDEVQAEVNTIEKEILDWRAANNDYTMDLLAASEKLGKRQRYEELLKQRDELMWRGNPKTTYTPKGDAWKDVEVKCPVTGKYTWSCNRCALLLGRDETSIECRARKGKKYRLAKGQTKTGTMWDTYVLRGPEKKTGERVRAIGGD